MTAQPSFLFLNPNVHTGDPTPSFEAADKMEKTGKRNAHALELYRAVCANPGLTSAQLSLKVTFDLTETRRRLTDLKSAGKVKMGPVVPCPVSGNRQSTWEVAA